MKNSRRHQTRKNGFQEKKKDQRRASKKDREHGEVKLKQDGRTAARRRLKIRMIRQNGGQGPQGEAASMHSLSRQHLF